MQPNKTRYTVLAATRRRSIHNYVLAEAISSTSTNKTSNPEAKKQQIKVPRLLITYSVFLNDNAHINQIPLGEDEANIALEVR